MTFHLERYRRIHFVGIGGIGMSGLARYLLTEGFDVSGSDRVASPQTQALSDLGIRMSIGHHPRNVEGTDLVVVSSAVGSDNAELRAARALSVPVMKRAELLADVMHAGLGIAVAGTHGKTTTSALIAHILIEAGHDPTVLIGGISSNFGSNARVGKGEIIVEADEYDASFLQLHPTIGVITNVEAEHLDFYGSVQGVEQAFLGFARAVTDTLIMCADDPVLVRLAAEISIPVIQYGLSAGDWRASDLRDENGKLHFRALHGRREVPVRTQLAGKHNAVNILAALAVAGERGVDIEVGARAIDSFAGVGRRCELVGEADGITVIDDYAVHPTEVVATIAAIRERFRRPIRVIFQPHTYSRTRDFLADFATSFGEADALYVMDIYAARETDTLGVSGQSFARSAERHHQAVRYTPSADETIDALLQDARPGDVVVTMGAGDVYRLGPQLLQSLNAVTHGVNKKSGTG